MTHSQKPSIDILKELIDFYNGMVGEEFKYVHEALRLAITEIQSLPQSPSVESLLEEMPDDFILQKMSDTNYWAIPKEKRLGKSAHGKTPLIALLALKEKLNNVNKT